MPLFLHQLDLTLFLFINSTLSNPIFNVFFTTITNGRFWIIPGVLGAATFLFKSKKKAVVVIILMLVTVSVSDPVCNKIIKPHFHRQRPCNESVHIPGAHFLLGHKTSPSFPSSHAMNMFAQATLLALLYRRKRVVITAFVFAGLIALSRVYVGVHYPIDVCAGAFFGIIIGFCVYFVFIHLQKRFKFKFLNSTIRTVEESRDS